MKFIATRIRITRAYYRLRGLDYTPVRRDTVADVLVSVKRSAAQPYRGQKATASALRRIDTPNGAASELLVIAGILASAHARLGLLSTVSEQHAFAGSLTNAIESARHATAQALFDTETATKQAAPEIPAPAGSTWRCEKCDTYNENGSTECTVCETSKPTV